MHLQLRHLRTVCAIADQGSLTKAAAAQGVSQPALTAQLRRIERLVGGPLFRRSRIGVVPTRFGEFVIARARTALMNADELTVGARRDGAAGTSARFGSVSGPVLIPLLRGLTALLPGTPITVRAEHSPRLLLDLLAGRHLDAAALLDHPGRELPPVPSIGVHRVAVEPVFVALPSGHRLAARAEVALRDLAGESWALPPPDGLGWPQTFIDACASAGFSPNVPHRLMEPQLLSEIIRQGRAIAACRATFPDGPGIELRPLAGNPLWIRHLIAWRDDGPFAAISGELGRLAARSHGQVAEDHPRYARWLSSHAETTVPL